MAKTASDEAGERVRATLEGHAHWAFRQYQRLTGKRNESNALTSILDSWLKTEDAERFGLTWEDYQRSLGGEVVDIGTKKKSSRGRP